MSEQIVSPMYVPVWRVFDFAAASESTYKRVLGEERIRTLFSIDLDKERVVFVTWLPYERGDK